MANLTFNKDAVPFLLGGTGQLNIDLGAVSPIAVIPEASTSLVHAKFGGSGGTTVQLGTPGSVKIGISAAANLDIRPVFSTSKGASAQLLKDNGLGSYFDDETHKSNLVLCLDAGGSADLSAAGSFTYAPLTASFEVKAGINGGYSYFRAFDKTRPSGEILKEFVSRMRLPEQGTKAPEEGEAIALRYGGYLNLSADVSAGYKLAGTKSISVADLALSEKYDLSIVGKLGLSASIAGLFSILVTADEKLAGWARVRVHRHRSNEFKVAGDINVGFRNTLEGLPGSADEFLGAVLGVNAKNFLNVFQKARALSDFDNFNKTVDGLAKQYITEYVGKAFDQLSKTEFDAFLQQVDRVVTSYQNLGDEVVTLYDRYVGGRIDILEGFIDRILSLDGDALATLRKDLSPELWGILSQLTGGDPLGFLVGNLPLKDVQDKAKKVLELIKNPGGVHDEIRKLVDLAKSSFGLDHFFGELAKIDSVDKLKALATDKIGMFVSRLVGRALKSNSEIKKAFDEVHAVLGRVDDFKNKWFNALSELANSSWKMALHAEYSRATDADALIDVSINMAAANGPAMLANAGKGEFVALIASTDTNTVRVNSGVLTHSTRRESAFSVHISGWHLNYQYEGFDRVITETEQRLKPTPDGLMIDSLETLKTERERKRRGEKMHVAFLLRAMGESKKVIPASPSGLRYLIETLTGLTASYQLAFTDDNTTSDELRDYLSFAADVGLDKQGATLRDLQPLLPKTATGTFGDVVTTYDVRFGKKAVEALLSVTRVNERADEAIRSKMRTNLLSNYLKTEGLHDVAFAYATAGVFNLFTTEGFAQFSNHFSRTFNVDVEMGIDAPDTVTLDRTELDRLVTLFNIENSMIKAIHGLVDLIAAGEKLDPREFEKRLGGFGSAMNDYDKFDQTNGRVGTNTVFIMFDTLVRLASPEADPANITSLTLKSTANGKSVEKIFLSDAAADRDDPLRVRAAGANADI